MTTLSSLFPQQSALPGGMTKDPRLLPLWDASGSLVGAGGNASQSTFWSQLANTGAVSTAASDDSYITNCNVTGRGVMFNAISPSITATTDAITFRITVDGIEYVITRSGSWYSASTSGGRSVIGAAADTYYGQHLNTAAGASWQQLLNTKTGAVLDRQNYNGGCYLISPNQWLSSGFPCLYFDQSLKVETKSSDVGTGTYGQYSAVSYQLLG